MVNVCTKYEVSTFGHSKDIKGVRKFRKWSRDLSHTPVGVKFSYFDKGLMQCISPQNLKCVSLSIQQLWRGCQVFNLGHVTPTTPTLGGQFVVLWLPPDMVNVRTKYEVSTFGHSKDIKGVPKFRK